MSEEKSSYDLWLDSEGVAQSSEVAGFSDITALPRKYWDRIGGNAVFLELVGTRQAQRGMYVAEIPGGSALKPEKHLYEKAIFILKGRGMTEIWQGENGPKQKFEWGPGSLFAIPLNATHRLINGTKEPCIFFAATTAPMIMNSFAENDFGVIFNSDYVFKTRWNGQKDFFAPTDTRVKTSFGGTRMLTNFIPDVRALFLDDSKLKVQGGQLTSYLMGRFPHGHVSEWPVGRYHAAHYHGPGAILIGLRAEGYALVWPNELGAHPYENGHGDKVLKVNWKQNSLYSPPNRWYHQHFNTGTEPARHVAIYGGMVDEAYSGSTSSREGGTLITYQDEDPEIRRQFEAELEKKGVKCAMPKYEAAKTMQ